jgi:hypothetical protein
MNDTRFFALARLHGFQPDRALRLCQQYLSVKAIDSGIGLLSSP